MNILDLNAEQFEGALKELALEPDREQFLRDEWAKKNTFSGQMLGAFQEATALPEGRERAAIAPMSKPEGMSGIEAIRAGKAEFAVPGFLTGSVEEPLQALTTGEKITSGIGVTQEEMQQAAEMGAGLGMANVPRAMSRGYDPRVVSIFGGYNTAKNPGKNMRGEPLPVSRGADTMYRFEIDDSASAISNLDTLTPVKSWKSIPENTTKLSDVLKHEELFYQYPELRDVKFVIDESTSNNNLGWALPDGSAIAISKGVSQNPELARRVIIHEVSHLVQNKENFSLGTNIPENGNDLHEVSIISKADINSPQNKQQWEDWKTALQETQRIENIQLPIEMAETFIHDLAVRRGLTLKQLENIQEPSIWDRAKSIFRPLPQMEKEELLKVSSLLRSLNTLSEMVKRGEVDFNYARGWVNSAYKNLSIHAQKLDEEELFTGVLGVDPKEFIKNPAYEMFFPEPELPRVPAPNSSYDQDYLHNVYERKAGEAEARNAANRLEMTLDERFQVDPQFTEDVARSLQWTTPYNYVPPAELFKQNYAEGGMVEDNQMKKLFQEGGMTDDGMNVEPVTGNEIPPGSMASEVRDDIPAQLSEGEYVVPADVVRFFGVKFFEDLRARAKQGLEEMDADGRIGGAPVDSSGVPVERKSNLSPEEEAMLMEVLGGTGMAYGGMVEQQPVMMAEGGVVYQPFEFDPASFNTPAGMGAFEPRRYINSTTGEERTIQFLNGMPMGAIPDGFVPWTAELANQIEEAKNRPAVEAPSVQTGRDRDSDSTTNQGGGEGSAGYADWAAENYDAIMSDPLGYAQDRYNEANQPKGLGGRLFGRTGIGGVVNDVATLNAISELEAAQSRTKSGSKEEAAIQGMIDDLAGNLRSNPAEAAYAIGVVATGTQRINALNKYAQEATGTQTAQTTGTQTTGTGTRTGGIREGGDERRSTSESTAPTTSTRPVSKPTTVSTPAGTKTVTSTPTSTGRTYTAPTTQQLRDKAAGNVGIAAPTKTEIKSEAYTGQGYTRGRAKGGLVEKPTKKPAKRKLKFDK